MGGQYRSEVDIKVFIPALTYCLLFIKVFSINGKRLSNFFVSKNKTKIQNPCLKNENNNFKSGNIAGKYKSLSPS